MRTGLSLIASLLLLLAVETPARAACLPLDCDDMNICTTDVCAGVPPECTNTPIVDCVDAGVPDASVQIDATPGAPDAGLTDGGTATLDGATPAADGATPAVDASQHGAVGDGPVLEGCTCRVPSRRSTGGGLTGALALLAVTAVALGRKRCVSRAV